MQSLSVDTSTQNLMLPTKAKEHVKESNLKFNNNSSVKTFEKQVKKRGSIISSLPHEFKNAMH